MSQTRPQSLSLNNLPDELLLNIGAQFTNLNRNRDLASLALVSKKWRSVAQEWLLKVPRFNLTYLDKYMWQLGHRPYLLTQIKSLEVWSSSSRRVRLTVGPRYEAVRAPALLLQDTEFKEQSRAIVQHFADTKRHEEQWLQALIEDIVPALFGVLICVLPKLKVLRLGDAWLLDFPIFANMLSSMAEAQPTAPSRWRQHFLAGALASTLTRLEVLEVPTDMTGIYFHSRITTIFDFRRFENLTEISLTMRALQGFRSAPSDPIEIFPKALAVLRITEATHNTVNFLNQLCLAKKRDSLSSLRRVEVYHLAKLQDIVDNADHFRAPHPVNDVRVMCRDAEIEVYLYFPPCIMKTWESGNGTPWRMRTETQALWNGEVACSIKDFGPFAVALRHMLDRVELEWDQDGDAVMV